MNEQVRQFAEQLLATGVDQLSDRERRVVAWLAKRAQISRDVNHAFEEHRTFGDRLADRVATFGGSWTFICLFLATLVIWVVLNSIVLAGGFGVFDPYPYIFLNLILSMLAALQAPIIMMSQNRQAARDRVAAGLDYEINLKAEIEIMALHDKLDEIRSTHLADLLRAQQEQFQLLSRLASVGNGTVLRATAE
ncbi:MAG TPA: DUF1003 domain-containing protein [Dongiaceae bacterium]|nr:DUF1003 domain-containing protein [Dongiaceae bacterium]